VRLPNKSLDTAYGVAATLGYTAGGSRGFVRLVAMSTPSPIKTITPTSIHIAGTLSRYAAIPNPIIRMMKPIRYVAKDDISKNPGEGLARREARAVPSLAAEYADTCARDRRA
jgi:hypothetical protein